MNRSIISALYHPSTVLFLDDNVNFLNSIPLLLDDDIPYVTYNDPNEALDVISKHQDIECQHPYHQSQDDAGASYIWSDLLGKCVSNAQRFDAVTVTVVDYSMPKMNGLEFFREIKSSFSKKILLTGAADANIAVDAFNEGIIDQFVVKGKDDETKINALLHRMQYEYFVDNFRAESIYSSIANNDKSLLKEDDYVELLRREIARIKAVEYYLIDSTGSYFLIDGTGNAYIHLVRSQSDMDMFYELASNSGLDAKILAQLKEGHAIPFFPKNMPFFKAEAQEWRQNLLAARTYHGRDGQFYYATINQRAFDFMEYPIQSFNRYLQQKWQ